MQCVCLLQVAIQAGKLLADRLLAASSKAMDYDTVRRRAQLLSTVLDLYPHCPHSHTGANYCVHPARVQLHRLG